MRRIGRIQCRAGDCYIITPFKDCDGKTSKRRLFIFLNTFIQQSRKATAKEKVLNVTLTNWK